MKDKAFLQFIHGRLKSVHGENENFDYMLKLQSIIDAMDPDACTPNVLKPLPSSTSSQPTPLGQAMDSFSSRQDIELCILYSSIIEDTLARELNKYPSHAQSYRKLFEDRSRFQSDADLQAQFDALQVFDTDQELITHEIQRKSLLEAFQLLSIDPCVIFSESERVADGAGFWSNEDGWVSLESASLFLPSTAGHVDPSAMRSAGGDAKWVKLSEAQKISASAEVGSDVRARKTKP